MPWPASATSTRASGSLASTRAAGTNSVLPRPVALRKRHGLILPDAARDRARIDDHAAAHADVEALGDEIDRAVVEAHLHFEQRMLLSQLRRQRQHEVAAEADAHRDAHAPADRDARARDAGHRVVEAAQRIACALGEVAAFGGERQAACRAVEQAHADLLL